MQNTRGYIERDREGGHTRLVNDYFRENATYSAQFRRRFRMNKSLFMRIVLALQENFVFFQQRPDATGRLGHSPLQKYTAATRLLAYGTGADTVDEYLRLAETSALLCLHNFTDGIIQLFGDKYLRRPTPDDLQRLLDIGEKQRFPGMIGSIDCMHWEWKNCPTAWKGQYARGSGKPTIVLEAVASQDLWIWHTFFGPPGTLNDINVLDRSPLFDDILEGRAPRYLPVGATSSTALHKQCKETILVNKEGNSWNVSLRFSESAGKYYITRGWRKFCLDNRCEIGDLFAFNVVGDGKTTPLMCVCPERKECSEILSKYLSRTSGEFSLGGHS
uniref:TF-B3 domain-containing protein n=1 Tax=Brassica oleracea var. oleracea TaxID=109376 RepID=A0A0D3CX87_BRAOL